MFLALVFDALHSKGANMRGVNKIFLLGRLGRDPELKTSANGRHFADLRLATNRAIRKDEEWIEVADWHQIRVWERTAELCVGRLTKGSPVAVEGQLRSDQWQTENGDKRSRTYVVGDRIHFLPYRSSQRALSEDAKA
jgi:single-strand DNA-binding protein